MDRSSTAASITAGRHPVARPHKRRLPTSARTATHAAFLGFAIDYFDIYLPVVALAPAIHYFEPQGLSASVQTTLFYITFAVTLLGRPVGSIVFGTISDRIGRRRSTLITIAGFTIATVAMAALPGYQQWGYGAITCLLVLRFCGGIFMGGEYTSANPLALESCPTPRRGFIGAYIASAYPIGYIAISLVTLPLLNGLPHVGVDSPYQQWGWRLPFLVGGLLGLLFFIYFRRSVDESTSWQSQSANCETPNFKRTTPLHALLRDPPTRRRLVQVMLVMTGLWFAIHSIISPTSGLLINYLNQDSSIVTAALLVANVALFLGYLGIGVLGQRYGRRRVLITSGYSTMTVSLLGYLTMIAIIGSEGNFVLAMVLYTISLVIAISPMGIATVYLIEAFPTRFRSSGYGFAFSVSVVIPSFYSAYMLGLSTIMPYVYTPLVLIALSGVLTALGAKIGTDNSDIDL